MLKWSFSVPVLLQAERAGRSDDELLKSYVHDMISSSVSLRTSSRSQSRSSLRPSSKAASAFGSRTDVQKSRPSSGLNRGSSMSKADVVDETEPQPGPDTQHATPIPMTSGSSRERIVSRPQSGLPPVDADHPLASSGTGQTPRPISSSWNGNSSRPQSGKTPAIILCLNTAQVGLL